MTPTVVDVVGWPEPEPGTWKPYYVLVGLGLKT